MLTSLRDRQGTTFLKSMLGIKLFISMRYQRPHLSHSDARSAQAVDDRIRPALESGSTVGSSKPILVIIDEIDGATGGSDSVCHRLGFKIPN